MIQKNLYLLQTNKNSILHRPVSQTFKSIVKLSPFNNDYGVISKKL